MNDWCFFFRSASLDGDFRAVALCARLPLGSDALRASRFLSEGDLMAALRAVGIADGEQHRILTALEQHGRSLTRLSAAQAERLGRVAAFAAAGRTRGARRPKLFNLHRRTACATSYQVLGQYNEACFNGGVLKSGAEVWLAGTDDHGRPRAHARAFVDGIGLITLDTRWLTSTAGPHVRSELRRDA